MTDNSAVVISIDQGYLEPACTMLRSLAANTSLAGVDVRVLHDDLDDAAVARLRDQRPDVLNVVPVMVPAPDIPVNEGSHISSASYRRLVAADECREFGRIAVLDVDLIVLGDIRELFEADLRNAVIGAVQDAFTPTVSSPYAFPEGPPDGAAGDLPYFNAGVMVVDTRRWMAADTTRRSVEFARHRSQTRIRDQESLNSVLIGRWTPVDPLWNCFPISELARHEYFQTMLAANGVALDGLRELEAQAKILHFVGRDKPWLDSYPDGRNRVLYRSYWQ
ncbi:MAG TPA: glycosyltransferase family 8 protein [Streptosporangiaceae bacterium]